jgi:23S rRNA (uracil1939-C5)-methyltransferase
MSRRTKAGTRQRKPQQEVDSGEPRLEIELVIDALAAGGDGIGRADDGRVVFVPFTAPGDRVLVEIRSKRARFAHGRVVTLLEPGPGRTDPVCPVFGTCGGCSWQHVDYKVQLESKAQILSDALSRLGGVGLEEEIHITPSPTPYHYRGRARVLAERRRVGFRKRKSHSLCSVRSCPILVPSVDRELGALADRAAASGDLDGEWELSVGVDGTRAIALSGEAGLSGSGRSSGSGGSRVEIQVGEDRFGISPGVFAQSNSLLQNELAAAVHREAGEGGLAVELFAGAGFFTLGLARKFERVIAIESNAAATRDLADNLRAANLGNVDVRCERVEGLGADGEWCPEKPDVLLLDPPRTGLPPGSVEVLAQGAGSPRRIVYVSCDPSTLARDLELFGRLGYRTLRVEGFDLFPQTPHVEAIAVLEMDI